MVKASIDWRLSSGIATQGNFALMLVVLFSFPLVLRWTGALSVQYVDPRSPEHTQAFVKFCLVLSAFLWGCFLIAYAGIRRCGRITPRALIGSNWSRWRTIAGDLGIALATLAALAIIGNLFNSFSGTLNQDSAVFRSMVAQNREEAAAFLALALTAGFVEEFVFRGYIQRQCQALCGSTFLASILQLAIFVSGHFYQGWIRLIPVLMIGGVLTIVALWRKSLLPGMIAHGLGDSLVAFSFFFKH